MISGCSSVLVSDYKNVICSEKAKKASEEKRVEERKAAEERKAQEKKAREDARIAERERKKAEALESKRYPMEDLQLLEELQNRAVSSGIPSKIFNSLSYFPLSFLIAISSSGRPIYGQYCQVPQLLRPALPLQNLFKAPYNH